MLYPTRQPITSANYEAAMASAPMPHVSNPENPRIVDVRVMGEWMLGHPGCTMDDLKSEFSTAELTKFLASARDYAIRKSGGIH